MDIATIVGVVVAFAAIFVSMIMEGGNPASIILPPAMVIVFGGTIGATMATGLLKDFTSSLAAIKDALMGKAPDPQASISLLVKLAEKARKDGLLALEQDAKAIDDPFLRKGIQLAVDGTDPDELREILEAEIAAKKAAGKVHAKTFADMGAFAPTMGIIGTVMGLIHVLENLAEPEKLGHLIAGAFVATLWGVLSANALWLPIGKKVARLSDMETSRMSILVEGILSVQAGTNPRVLQEKLESYVADGKAQQKKAA